MIQLDPRRRQLTIGETFHATLRRDGSAVETRFFLNQIPIVEVQPFIGWGRHESVEIFPEAPGRYELVAEWRDPTQAGHGAVAVTFDVAASRERTPAPSLISTKSGKLWAPSSWGREAIEDAVMTAQRFASLLLRPGQVVYDIGANVGAYAAAFADAVGPRGKVVCFEPNPICVGFLRSNLLCNGIANVEILPVVLLDRTGQIRFRLNFANSNLGIAEGSTLWASKIGQLVELPCRRLDELAAAARLAPPDVIKLDVEGSEALVLEGMRKILATRRPPMLIELHGRAATEAALEILSANGYVYEALEGGPRLRSAAEVIGAYGDAVVELVARPHPDPHGESSQ